MGAAELRGARGDRDGATGLAPGGGGPRKSSARAPSPSSAPSNWPWRTLASPRWWPQPRRTVPRTATGTCCPVSVEPLPFSPASANTRQHPRPLFPSRDKAPAPVTGEPLGRLLPTGSLSPLPAPCVRPSRLPRSSASLTPASPLRRLVPCAPSGPPRTARLRVHQRQLHPRKAGVRASEGKGRGQGAGGP